MLPQDVKCCVELIGTPVGGNVNAVGHHEQTDGVTHLGENHHAALELGSPEVLDSADFTDLLGVVGQTSKTTLPGEAHFATGIPSWVSKRVHDVGLIGDVGLVQFLNETELTPTGSHPLGGNNNVRPNVLTQLKLIANLGVVGVVVVVVDHVVDGDSGLLLETHQGGVVTVVVFVDVERPVRPVQCGVGGRNVFCGDDVATGSTGRQPECHSTTTGSGEERTPREL